jgi:hypothetical protein
MDQQSCLSSPHHFTHLGVCYVGTNFYIQLQSPTSHAPVTAYVGHAVPEPGTFLLMATGLVFLRARSRRLRA